MAVSFLAENKTMQTIRARVAFHSRQHGFDKCMQQILDPEQAVTGSLLADLYAYWGDPLTPGDEQFLRSCLAEAGAARGPVLLAGASLLTLILGAVCSRSKDKACQVWCLESDRHWANLIRSWLTEYRIDAAHVIHSPARLAQDHVWYSVDTGRLARSYALVICDGARSTPRGVMGAIKRLGSRLEPKFTVLARNVKEGAVLRSLNAWAGSNDAKFALIDKQEGFIKLARLAAAPAANKSGNTISRPRDNGIRSPGSRRSAAGKPATQPNRGKSGQRARV